MAKKTKKQKRNIKLKKRSITLKQRERDFVFVDEQKIKNAFPDKQERKEYIRALVESF